MINTVKLKTEVHDMSNLLMRLEVNIKRGRLDIVKTVMELTLASFARLKHEVYEGTETKLDSLLMADRFENLKTLVPKYADAYGIKIDINRDQCAEDVRMFFSPDFVDAISSNVVQNASKAGATHLLVTYIARPCFVLISFKDNGKGMSEDELDSLGFNTPGHGVWLIRSMVHANNGVCYWKSEPGMGTEFIVKLKRDSSACPALS